VLAVGSVHDRKALHQQLIGAALDAAVSNFKNTPVVVITKAVITKAAITTATASLHPWAQITLAFMRLP